MTEHTSSTNIEHRKGIPVRVCVTVDCSASQSLAVLSQDAVTTLFPSGNQSTAITAPTQLSRSLQHGIYNIQIAY